MSCEKISMNSIKREDKMTWFTASFRVQILTPESKKPEPELSSLIFSECSDFFQNISERLPGKVSIESITLNVGQYDDHERYDVSDELIDEDEHEDEHED
jgi:hypothetical protein